LLFADDNKNLVVAVEHRSLPFSLLSNGTSNNAAADMESATTGVINQWCGIFGQTMTSDEL
jgi:hypothetical protein